MSAPDAEPAVGDPLDVFLRREGQGLLRFAYLLTGGQGAAAEDLVQAVLARLVRRGIDDLTDPRTYARRSIVNESHSLARRAAAQLRAMSRHGAGAEAEPRSEQSEDRATLFAALRKLTERERAAVVLRYYEDFTDDQIAEVLGCSRPTVRSLVHRALPKLRGDLLPTYRPNADDDRNRNDGSHG